MAPTEDPDHTHHKKKVNLHDASGAEHKDVRCHDFYPDRFDEWKEKKLTSPATER